MSEQLNMYSFTGKIDPSNLLKIEHYQNTQFFTVVSLGVNIEESNRFDSLRSNKESIIKMWFEEMFRRVTKRWFLEVTQKYEFHVSFKEQ